MDTHVLDTRLGASIQDEIARAINEAEAKGLAVKVEFNGVTVIAHGDSDPKLIYRDWSRAMSGYIEKNVGPYPPNELSDAEKASDARIEAENEKRRQAATEKARKAQWHKELLLEGALSVAPPMEFLDEDGWNKAVEANDDPYGSGVIRFAERWARLMQAKLKDGCTIAGCAQETSHIADSEGITGFMYGCAVSILAQCWIHGEQLRRWHNTDSQLGDEGDKANESGGVLNPAVLNIATK